MSGKAIIVVDFAYKGPQRTGRGTGPQGLKAMLKYLQYRDKRNNHLAQSRSYERWQDRGMGVSHSEIYRNCDRLQSRHVLAWTWVISPDPELMAMVPPADRRQLLLDLTERVVETYYAERGFEVPEYSYVLHTAQTREKKGAPVREHLHTHVVLPGTAPSTADRLPVYNNSAKGHDRLFRDIATDHFAHLLDERNIEWRRLREIPPPEREAPSPEIDFDDFFSR